MAIHLVIREYWLIVSYHLLVHALKMYAKLYLLALSEEA